MKGTPACTQSFVATRARERRNSSIFSGSGRGGECPHQWGPRLRQLRGHCERRRRRDRGETVSKTRPARTSPPGAQRTGSGRTSARPSTRRLSPKGTRSCSSARRYTVAAQLSGHAPEERTVAASAPAPLHQTGRWAPIGRKDRRAVGSACWERSRRVRRECRDARKGSCPPGSQRRACCGRRAAAVTVRTASAFTKRKRVCRGLKVRLMRVVLSAHPRVPAAEAVVAGMRSEVGQRLVAACERAAGSPLRSLFPGPGAA